MFLDEDRSISWDILLDPRIRANAHVVANGDRPKDLRARAHHHVVAQGRVALVVLLHKARDLVPLEVERADSDTLVQPAPATDDGRLADDGPRGVVDEEEVPDLGARVDVDPGVHVGELRELTRVNLRPGLVENVGHALDGDGPKARVAADDFGVRGTGGVADEGGVDVFLEGFANVVQPINVSWRIRWVDWI